MELIENKKHKLGLPRMKDINTMTDQELRDGIKELREIRMSEEGKKKKATCNGARLRETKRTIARMMTLLAKRTFRG